MTQVTIYTDGSSPGNGNGHGRGGWCAILSYNGIEKVLSGHLVDATNNIAELTAIREGLSALLKPCDVTIVTDSQFCIGTLSLGWKRKDFECAKVSREIDALMKIHNVRFEHVRGHQGHPENERCDMIARQMADSLKG